MEGPPIRSVEAGADYILRVNWAGGSATLLNMRPQLASPRFIALRDETVWRSVTTDGYTIRWRDAKGYPYDMAEYEVNQFANGV